jgi:hypothetical protein
LREKPEVLKKLVFENINRRHNINFYKKKTGYALQIIKGDIGYPGIALGRIINFRIADEIEKWDPITQQINKVVEENNILEKAFFFYHQETETLLVEERRNLDVNTIRNVITAVVNYDKPELEIDLNPKLHSDEAMTRIKSFKKITWAHFELIPNNPDQRLWDMFDQILEKLGSTDSKHDFHNKNGLQYSSDLEQVVNDVNEGRSRRYIIGGLKEDDVYDEVRSHEFIRRIYKDVEPTDEGRRQGLWEITKEILNL